MNIKMDQISKSVQYFERKQYILEHLEQFKELDNLLNKEYDLQNEIDFLEMDLSDRYDRESLINGKLLSDVNQSVREKNNLIESLKALESKHYSFIDLLKGKKKVDQKKIEEIKENLSKLWDVDQDLKAIETYTLCVKEMPKVKKDIESSTQELEFTLGYLELDRYQGFEKNRVNELIQSNRKHLEMLKESLAKGGQLDIESAGDVLSALGWEWHCYDEESASLDSPDGKTYFEYDYSTREYKCCGQWHCYDEEDSFSAEEMVLRQFLIVD